MDLETLHALVDKFNELYPKVRDFFVDANGIASIRSVFISPILPKDPPQFEMNRKITKSESLPNIPTEKERPFSPKPIRSEVISPIIFLIYIASKTTLQPIHVNRATSSESIYGAFTSLSPNTKSVFFQSFCSNRSNSTSRCHDSSFP